MKKKDDRLRLEMAENLRVAFDLFVAGEALLRRRLWRENPRASPESIEAEVIRWLQTRRGAEAGDGEGKRVPWPRPRRARSSER